VLQEFIDCFQGYKIGDKISVRDVCLPPFDDDHVPATSDIVEWVNRYGNCFEITNIQQLEKDNAVFSLHEVRGVLDFWQIEPFVECLRVVNF